MLSFVELTTAKMSHLLERKIKTEALVAYNIPIVNFLNPPSVRIPLKGVNDVLTPHPG